MFRKRKKKKARGLDWSDAPDIKKRVIKLIRSLDMGFEAKQIYCFRSTGSKARAYARIWGLNRVWQKALCQKPAYVIEVLAEKFDSLGSDEKTKVLLHELAHIPKNFSGSLLPHTRKGKRNFHDRVEKMYSQYKKMNTSY